MREQSGDERRRPQIRAANTTTCGSVFFEKLPDFNLEALRNPGDVVDRDIALGPLDGAKVRTVDAALMG